MIPVNELTLGNLIMPTSEHFTKEYLSKHVELDEDILFDIKQTRKETVESNIFGDEKNKEVLALFNYSPLKITEDFLKENDFQRFTSLDQESLWCYGKTELGLYLYLCVEEKEAFEVGEWYIQDGEQFLMMPNVHWLQNWYFFNTGYKLELI